MNCRIVVTAACLTLTIAPQRAEAAAPFEALPALEVSFRPRAVDLRDLDGDLDLDLVVVSQGEFDGQWNGSLVHVFLNPGDGSFPLRADYVVPAAPAGLAISDLDGDGTPDLITACTAPDVLQVLLNDGAGGFVTGAAIPTGIDPVAVTSADFDGDGDRDLASADQFSARVTVAWNDGAAQFPTTTFHALPGPPVGIVSADVDLDLDVDLLVVGNGALLLRNDGTGQFAAPVEVIPGTVTPDGELCLFDGDGHLDLVTSTHVWLGLGNGSFQPSPIPTGLGNGHARGFDFDGDGHRDVVTSLGIAWADGLGGLLAPTPLDAAPLPGPVCAGDVDGDQVPDLVRLQSGAAGPVGFAVIRRGAGAGAMAVWPRWPAGSSVWAVCASDVDRDGRADAIVGNVGAGTGFQNAALALLRGTAGGGLGPAVSVPAGTQLRATSAGDLNADGAPDLVATNRNAGTVSVFLNDGAGGFATRDPLAAGTAPEDVILADLDRDQDLEIVVSNSPTGATPASVTILHGDGSGGFPASQTVALSGHAAVRIAAADLDADGWTDLAVVCNGRVVSGGWAGHGLFVLRNQGGGVFGPESFHATTGLPRTVVAADVDGDADPDLVVTDMDPAGAVILSGRILAFRNDGAGNFPAPVSTLHRVDHFNAACADFDGDGRADIALPYLSAGVVTVLLGDGTGAFPRKESVATGLQPRAVAAADFNLDGRSDLVVAHSTIHEAGVLVSRPATVAVGTGGGAPALPIARLRGVPNPFRSHARLVIESAADAGRVGARVQILDMAGRRLQTLPLTFDATGRSEVTWDGRAATGERLPAGMYFARYAGKQAPAVVKLLRLP